MGQEIVTSRFRKQDFERFSECLSDETALLWRWFQEGRFADGATVAGFELESWLVAADGRPAALNSDFISKVDSPLVVPELSQYNVEINTPQRILRGDALERMESSLSGIWRRCEQTARDMGIHLGMIGILPTVRERDLDVEHMSDMVRYRALNEQVLRLRQGKPLDLEIQGADLLRIQHPSVMLEAATTSFQVHLQASPRDVARLFNAAVVVSSSMVAASANSSYLFGRELWRETRIPLFEQAVDVCAGGNGDALPRVTFGTGYLHESFFELFRENLEMYPPLLPMCQDEAPGKMAHLRLHNGTIWRWNRPLIGFDDNGAPHLRIEHRVLPAGPSICDTIANAALYYGLVHELATWAPAPERQLGYEVARSNFYAAARLGLDAEVEWLDGRRTTQRLLILEHLLPAARRGLERLEIAPASITRLLGIIEARVSSGRTGAEWQRDFVARNGTDMQALTLAYIERQESGQPVHEWGVLC